VSFDTKIYDADQVAAGFAGVLISKGAGASGYADGEFIRIVQNAESFTAIEGTDGTVTRSKTNRRLCTITIRVMQSNSATNGFLSAMLLLDEGAPNGAGIGTFFVKDLQGTTLFEAQYCWVVKPPDQSFDREAKEREWQLMCVRDNILVGGN
jgi:structural protein KPP10_ORF10